MSAKNERDEVEEFLYQEAALLDEWNLRKWQALFTPDGEYLIVTPNIESPETASPTKSLFLVADDQERLTQRVERLLDKSAHAEFPHSKTRHCLSNIRIESSGGAALCVRANFVIYRTKNDETTYFPGHVIYELERDGLSFRIHRKRCIIDTDSLAMQGKVSIIL
jgi:p-cumate 2,3-dioxygenase beta subunit